MEGEWSEIRAGIGRAETLRGLARVAAVPLVEIPTGSSSFVASEAERIVAALAANGARHQQISPGVRIALSSIRNRFIVFSRTPLQVLRLTNIGLGLLVVERGGLWRHTGDNGRFGSNG